MQSMLGCDYLLQYLIPYKLLGGASLIKIIIARVEIRHFITREKKFKSWIDFDAKWMQVCGCANFANETSSITRASLSIRKKRNGKAAHAGKLSRTLCATPHATMKPNRCG